MTFGPVSTRNTSTIFLVMSGEMSRVAPMHQFGPHRYHGQSAVRFDWRSSWRSTKRSGQCYGACGPPPDSTRPKRRQRPVRISDGIPSLGDGPPAAAGPDRRISVVQGIERVVGVAGRMPDARAGGRTEGIADDRPGRPPDRPQNAQQNAASAAMNGSRYAAFAFRTGGWCFQRRCNQKYCSGAPPHNPLQRGREPLRDRLGGVGPVGIVLG